MKILNGFSILLLFLTSCSLLRKSEVTGASIDPRVRQEQERELKKADQALEARDFSFAEKQYSQFQLNFPNSIFYQRAQFGLARSLEEQGRWSEAAALYRLTVDATYERQKSIAAQALFELSFCYENLGDESRVLASLMEALKFKEQLSPEQRLAEIPARLAASYQRMGLVKESEEALRKAEAGIFEIQAARGHDSQPQWLAQIYHRMGRFSTNQLSYGNLQAHLDTLKMVQIFSLRGAEAQGEPWSGLAVQRLIENYRDFWNLIQQIPLNQTINIDVAKRERAERQIHFTGQFLALINDLRLNRMPENKDLTGAVQNLFSYLNKIESQGKELLMSFGEQNILTLEAQKREGLKREGLSLQSTQKNKKENKKDMNEAEELTNQNDPNL